MAVGRRTSPNRKAELLDAIVDYLLAHGLSDLSLRPLAEALKTSPRDLLYHFSSKEQLVILALNEVRRRQQQTVASWMEEDPGALRGTSLEEIVGRFWTWLSSERNEPFLRLFFEVYGLALKDPERYPGFPEAAVADWFPMLERAFLSHGLAPAQAQARATVLVAAIRGLLLDLLAIGDRHRVDGAYNELVATMVQLNSDHHAERKERRAWLRR